MKCKLAKYPKIKQCNKERIKSKRSYEYWMTVSCISVILPGHDLHLNCISLNHVDKYYEDEGVQFLHLMVSR